MARLRVRPARGGARRGGLTAATRAIHEAEKGGIPFSVHEYRHDAGAAFRLEAAEKLGIDPARVFKTLVA